MLRIIKVYKSQEADGFFSTVSEEEAGEEIQRTLRESDVTDIVVVTYQGNDLAKARVDEIDHWHATTGSWQKMGETPTCCHSPIRVGDPIDPWSFPREFKPLMWRRPATNERRYAIAGGGPFGGTQRLYPRAVKFWDELGADEVRAHVYSWRAECRRRKLKLVEYSDYREAWGKPGCVPSTERVFYPTPGMFLRSGRGPDRDRVYAECGVKPPRPEDAEAECGHLMMLAPHPAVMGQEVLEAEARKWRAKAERVVVGGEKSPARAAYLEYAALCEKFARRRRFGIADLAA